jgi:GNAT superfamily N-acetyltransferase
MPTTKLRFTPEFVRSHRLDDGTWIRLRLLRARDRRSILEGFERLSPESRYTRFFSAMPELPESVLEQLVNTDGWNRLAITAETAGTDDVPGEGVGIARFIRLDESPDMAEAAVAVVDHMQGRGIGKLLLTELSDAARERGITRFHAQVLRNNAAMLGLLHGLAAHAVPDLDGAVATFRLDLVAEEPQASPLFDLLRAAGRGLQVVLERLGHFPE